MRGIADATAAGAAGTPPAGVDPVSWMLGYHEVHGRDALAPQPAPEVPTARPADAATAAVARPWSPDAGREARHDALAGQRLGRDPAPLDRPGLISEIGRTEVILDGTHALLAQHDVRQPAARLVDAARGQLTELLVRIDLDGVTAAPAAWSTVERIRDLSLEALWEIQPLMGMILAQTDRANTPEQFILRGVAVRVSDLTDVLHELLSPPGGSIDEAARRALRTQVVGPRNGRTAS